MKCSVCIATSADGYIATPDGGVEWLDTAGNPEADMGDQADMGIAAFMDSVDGMVMGRKTMEKLSSFNLEPEQWPYGEMPIVVLSRTLNNPPANLEGRVEIHGGEIQELMARLEGEGHSHLWIDGGSMITSFLELGLIEEMTITRAPIILGEGIPLFGKTSRPFRLSEARATAYANDFVQVQYRVDYG